MLLSVAACGRTDGVALAASGPPPDPGGAQSTEGSFPTSVVDGLGRTVTIAREPRRIVSLLPSHTEMLFALGAFDRVIGVDDFSDYPPEATKLPRLGDLYTVRTELLLSSKPDLVLASDFSPGVPTMAGAGLTVWAGSPRTVEDVCRVATTLGALIGRTAAARALCERVDRDILAVEQSARSATRKRVYYELDATPYAVGPRSFIGELLAKAGGDNVVPAELGDFPKVSPELIAAADPEVILGAPLEEIARRPGWEHLTAVQTKRVFALAPEERAVVVRPGPRLAEGLSVLVRKLHAEAAP